MRQAGIAGMGGAGFPSAVKLSVKPDLHRSIHLIINGTECEPYITADDVLMRERAGRHHRGARASSPTSSSLDETLIGVENNKAEGNRLPARRRPQGTDIEVVSFSAPNTPPAARSN